jgi:hypothetical protein
MFFVRVLGVTSVWLRVVGAELVMAAVWVSVFAAAGCIIRSRALRNLTYGLVGVLIIAGLAWVSWKPLLRNCAVRWSESYFRQSFKPNRDMYVCMDKDNWAWRYFGGTKGLPALQELSCDESLAPCGRNLASNLITHISYGRHLCSFDKYTRGTTWWWKKYLAYIREQDWIVLGRLHPVNTRFIIKKLEMAVQIHAMHMNGNLPDQLDDLFRTANGAPDQRDHVDASDMIDQWGTPIRYSKKGKHFKFRSAGPDCVFDTDDDITN